jgi:hypothetical protein
MKKILLATLCVSPLLLGLAAAVEPRAPTDAEIRYKQAIGRALVAPDGTFFVYEWMRPYNWVRDTGNIPKPAAERMQTWLYRVDIDRTPPNSEYVFFPGSGNSYWLGSFSQDGRHLSFYELDNDENVLKTGVVTFTDPITPKLTWFDAAPDGGKLDQPPVWLSNDELAYPTKSGLVRAKVPPEKKPDEESPINMLDYDKPTPTQACADCATLVAQAKAANEAAEKAKLDKDKRKKAAKLPADGRLLAQSADGELTVFERSNKKVIGVLFRKGVESPEPTVVFENERVLPPWSPPKWPDRKESGDEKKADKPVADASSKPAEKSVN